MVSPCGRYVLAYNGEVYNYREIAAELGDDPILAVSGGDTAVVLAAIARWGNAAFARFNGMWALAYYDRFEDKLVLCRDRLGVKPLYVHRAGNRLLAASEIKAILRASEERFPIDPDVVARYLLQSTLDDTAATFFKGITALRPGTFIEHCLAERSLDGPAPVQFWKHPFERDHDQRTDSLPVREVKDAFLDAVRLRLRSDVPVGLLLSGGIDSSSILGAVKHAGEVDGLTALSVVSTDERADESHYADIAARHAGVRMVRLQIDLEPLSVLRQLEEACWFNDQPFGTMSVVAHRLLMERAHELGITVLLTGQGADEQLAGYNKFLYFHLYHLLRRHQLGALTRTLSGSLVQRTVLPHFRLSEAKRYMRWSRETGRSSLAGPYLRDASLAYVGPGESYEHREWLDVTSLSIPALLHYEDRMSMSWSREMRCPFMDYRLVELLAKLPPSEKLKGGWTKAIFRAAMRGLVPDEVLWRRRKQGFDVPEESWSRGPLSPAFRRLLVEEPLLAADLGFVDRAAVRAIYERYEARARTVSYKEIFNLYCFETWLRRYESHVAAA
jgi:asparagine synthase (glutamine-hydrolysing)